ncbi:DUF2812 domain-containing protein [Faecalibacterium gallinarum]|uniref:DUF2812 domain-containing protein n=1 Tax=Faecalibacterium gallinarum TaxID=2903556 RepID=A0AA37IWF6_9FIRM|nr:DUF2812 domain-containing protein [Faecalibacterium gallinarum]GJN63695.1 hypothetical protein JCM17207_03200 [Faecalibacterium gallinarum]
MSEAGKNRKTVWRVYWLWQYEEEEAWLNRMAAEGWVLEEVHFFRYVFTRCQPGEYTVRLEMMNGSPEKEENQEYIWFVRGTGAEYVGKLKNWIYFRKKTVEGPFELFSDLDSRLTHVERVLWLAATLLLVIAFGTMNMMVQVISLRDGQMDNGNGFLLILYLFMLLWIGRGTWKLWALRKKLKEERSLRE